MTSSQTIPIDGIDAIDGIWQLCSEYDAMLIAVCKDEPRYKYATRSGLASGGS